MNYYFSDFTEENYVKLLRLAKKEFIFIGYDEALNDGRNMLWRHDIDYSIHRALALARLEHQNEVKSTYFIYIHSQLYNFFELESMRIAKEIVSLGHDLGLHADIEFYSDMDNSSVEISIAREKELIENIIEHKLTAVSFHQPEYRNSMSIKQNVYANMINAYSSIIFDRYFYCSDSNGYWRFCRLEDVLRDKSIASLQVLTHPEWWAPEAMSPAARIRRCINGRARSNWKSYCDELADCKRENVGMEEI
jgi:hypothetical protein